VRVTPPEKSQRSRDRVVALAGELDELHSATARHLLLDAVGDGVQHVVVDLSQVPFGRFGWYRCAGRRLQGGV
jgi:anti-anti-sigma regulatory factor